MFICLGDSYYLIVDLNQYSPQSHLKSLETIDFLCFSGMPVYQFFDIKVQKMEHQHHGNRGGRRRQHRQYQGDQRGKMNRRDRKRFEQQRNNESDIHQIEKQLAEGVVIREGSESQSSGMRRPHKHHQFKQHHHRHQEEFERGERGRGRGRGGRGGYQNHHHRFHQEPPRNRFQMLENMIKQNEPHEQKPVSKDIGERSDINYYERDVRGNNYKEQRPQGHFREQKRLVQPNRYQGKVNDDQNQRFNQEIDQKRREVNRDERPQKMGREQKNQLKQQRRQERDKFKQEKRQQRGSQIREPRPQRVYNQDRRNDYNINQKQVYNPSEVKVEPYQNNKYESKKDYYNRRDNYDNRNNYDNRRQPYNPYEHQKIEPVRQLAKEAAKQYVKGPVVKEVVVESQIEQSKQIPEYLLCPISYTLMVCPMLLVTCGHTFEEKIIRQWLLKQNKCPLCNKPAQTENLIKNFALAEVCSTYK